MGPEDGSNKRPYELRLSRYYIPNLSRENLRLSNSATCYVVFSELFNSRACIFLEIVIRIQNVLRRLFYGLMQKLMRTQYEVLASSVKGLVRHRVYKYKIGLIEGGCQRP